ncbi:hypothetical protein CPARA_2gp289 (nucleomorph) [Cryptomonas paramecium]|uniref:Uncharacterized protein n=1 Tax=Cryptomonas paramaecium TaxID=2898 RepID=F2HI01_9CRYP|nr:hypothetical protein CPARA_2gp289 [Cryptomonas paramecium]AEA38947.1 hypothetical protein CPARA_2gp289 [Cryptomonas paramecium]|mmetsp:Transcript_52419/g.137245  ORF Transcript_52419/g.137245 Transcript_52419/m.137245 type:complete len:332 (-) Transcript_52419:995-1990(-)
MFIFDKIVTDVIYTLILLNGSLIYNKTKTQVSWKDFFRKNFKLLFKPKILIKNQALPSVVYKNIFKKINNKLHKFKPVYTGFFYKKIKLNYVQHNTSKNFTWSLFKKEYNAGCVNFCRTITISYTIRIVCYFCLNETYLIETFDYSNLIFVNFIEKTFSSYFYKNFITFNHFCVYCRERKKMNQRIQIKFFDSNSLSLCHICSLFITQPVFYINNVVEKKNYFFSVFATYENKINFVLKNRLKTETSVFVSILVKINVFLKINLFFLIKAVSNNISKLMIFLKEFKKISKRLYSRKNARISILKLYNKYINKFFFENCKKLDNYIDLCDSV